MSKRKRNPSRRPKRKKVTAKQVIAFIYETISAVASAIAIIEFVAKLLKR